MSLSSVKYKTGNLANASERYIAHGCNAQGVMGAGVAKAIRAKYPDAFQFYRWNYEQFGLVLGDIVIYTEPMDGPFAEYSEPDNKIILNCITQEHYGRNPNVQYVDYEAVKSCILKINKIAPGKNVAMSKIGSNHGGGDWDVVEKLLIENAQFQPVVYSL